MIKLIGSWDRLRFRYLKCVFVHSNCGGGLEKRKKGKDVPGGGGMYEWPAVPWIVVSMRVVVSVYNLPA